jgi:hypothetical protein
MRQTPRRAHKVDGNQAIIVEALRSAGAVVFIIEQPFDLLIWYRGKWMIMEIKMPGKKPNEKQQADIKTLWEHGAYTAVYLASTPEEALQAIGSRLTSRQG